MISLLKMQINRKSTSRQNGCNITLFLTTSERRNYSNIGKVSIKLILRAGEINVDLFRLTQNRFIYSTYLNYNIIPSSCYRARLRTTVSVSSKTRPSRWRVRASQSSLGHHRHSPGDYRLYAIREEIPKSK